MHWLGEIFFQIVVELITWPFQRALERKCTRARRRKAYGSKK